MAFLQRLLAGGKRRVWRSNDDDLGDFFGTSTSKAGVSVGQHTALTYSAVWAAVRVISETIASLPLILYRRLPGGGKERFTDHPLYGLLHDAFNPDMTSMVSRETMQAHVLTWGNCYAEIVRDGLGRPVALWPISPDDIRPEIDKSGNVVYKVDGGRHTMQADEVLHVPGLGFDGIQGYSVVRMARESIGLGLANEGASASFIGNGMQVSGVLEHPSMPVKEAREEARLSFEKKYAGSDKAGKVAALWGGITFKPITMPAKDAQFIEGRKFQISEIARWFNIPPHLIRDLEHATFSNIEHQGIDFVTYTLRPWLIRWEQEIRRKLLTEQERRVFFAEHLVDALLRGDAITRAQALQIQLQNGVLTPDQWNEIENRNPLPDGLGKKHYMLAALVPVDKASAAAAGINPSPDTAGGAASVAPAKIEAPAPTPPLVPDRSAVVQEAARGVFLDVVGRMARREAEAARHAAKEPSKFLAWLDAFWPKQRDMIIQATRAARSLLAALGKDEVDRFVGQHVERARAQLLELSGCPADKFNAEVERWADRWEIESPVKLTSEVMP